MSNEHRTADESALSLARYPDPACSYEFDGETPVLESANDHFRDLCGAHAGDVLETAFDELEICGTAPAFDDETQFHVRTNGSQYEIRVIPPEDREVGYLLFTTPAESDCESVGVDRVASVVSHDLRNPLDVARARLRAGRELDSDEHLEHVAQAHDRMERIIQDVLTLARGEDVVDPDERVDLGAVAADAWETVETNGASLEIEDDLPVAKADEDRVSRLFENLFRNAVEHGSTSPDSQARQDAVEHGSTGTRPEADTAVEHGSTDNQEENRREHTHVVVGSLDDGFYVADDGPGIPKAERGDIFQPGYTSSEHGTGLGLAIVERIAQLHDWSIKVGSSAAGGARFEITDVNPN